jgi:hypothetical protein
MRDILHDTIDAQEELGERALAIVDAMRPKLPDLVRRLLVDAPEMDDPAQIIEEALTLIAAAVEAELADLTTEAVATGARFARARAGKKGLGDEV